MKSLFSVVCLTVLVGMATPCCLPDQGSFDFTMQKNLTATYIGSPYSFSRSLNGSVSFDFAEQKFYLSVPEYKAEAYIELSTNKKSATVVSEGGPRERCFEADLDGKIGKPWQCVLGNRNIFVFNALGQGKYVLLLPSLAFGVITMKNGTCFPTGADVEYYFNGTDFTWTSNVHLELTNIDEKVVDETVFKAPCKAERRNGNTYTIPTPNEFVRLMYETVANYASESESESDSKEASPNSDEDNSYSESDDREDSEESESEDKHDKKKKRGAP